MLSRDLDSTGSAAEINCVFILDGPFMRSEFLLIPSQPRVAWVPLSQAHEYAGLPDDIAFVDMNVAEVLAISIDHARRLNIA